jgi:enamine deaminase RidA (YjgF/YER057c/UK114 family)
MRERFTEQAQDALHRAQQIMFARQHTQMDVEHIFLALLQQRNSLPAQIITRAGGDVQAMTGRVENALNDMPGYKQGRGAAATGYITLRASRVLQGAAEEADHLNDEYISTEHLLIAIAREQGGITARILEEASIDANKIYAALCEIRGDLRVTNSHPEAHYVSKIQNPKSKIINPPTLAKPIGFNHGILTTGGRFLFLSGQTALDAEGKIVAPGDVVAQYRQVLSNLKAVVEEAGGKMQDIVKITIFVRDRDDYVAHLKELGQVHKSFFGAYYPATALLEISRFFDEEALVEIEGIAVLGAGDV